MTIAAIGPPMKTQYQAASRNDLRAIGMTASAKATPIRRLVVSDVGVGEGRGRALCGVAYSGANRPRFPIQFVH